jgi:hypothetical protein
MRAWLLNHCDWLTADDATLAEAEDLKSMMTSAELRHACAARGLALLPTTPNTTDNNSTTATPASAAVVVPEEFTSYNELADRYDA